MLVFEFLKTRTKGFLVSSEDKKGLRERIVKRNGETKKKMYAHMLVTDGTHFHAEDYCGLPVSGEATCMHVIFLLYGNEMYGLSLCDYSKHRAYILASVITFILSPKAETWLASGSQSYMVFKTIQSVIKSDFTLENSDISSIQKIVEQCHFSWPEGVSCELCGAPLYTPGGDSIVIWTCCGQRQHAECLCDQENTPPCTSESCCLLEGKEEKKEANFVFVSSSRHPICVLDSRTIKSKLSDLIQASDQKKKEGRWKKPAYLTDKRNWPERKRPFELESAAGKHRGETLTSPVQKKRRTRSPEGITSSKKVRSSKKKKEKVVAAEPLAVTAEPLSVDHYKVGYPEGEKADFLLMSLLEAMYSVFKLLWTIQCPLKKFRLLWAKL